MFINYVAVIITTETELILLNRFKNGSTSSVDHLKKKEKKTRTCRSYHSDMFVSNDFNTNVKHRNYRNL